MRYFCVTTVLLLLQFICLCQFETNVWYYQNGEGLDFTGGTPTLLSNGSIMSSEGTASISDEFGNLLFYTDGVTIWNKNHSPMPNGQVLTGNISTLQSAMIIPHPINDRLFFVFTLDQTCGSYGLRYSVVNMTLDLGKGDVITSKKNIPLLDSAFEKMAAVHHCNGTDVWLMAMKSNGDFYAWLVTGTGICNCPVISRTGPVHEQGMGEMKFSNNGEKLVVVEDGGACNGNSIHSDLYNFNNNTGEVEFVQTIQYADISNSSSGGRFWGASFSPNNEILYLSTGFSKYQGTAGISISSALIQFDLISPNIENSAVLVYDNYYDPTNPTRGCGSPLGSLQLAPDNKIYVGNFCSMDVIENPDILGLGCNYVHNAVPSSSGSGYGITNFIESYFGEGISSCPIVLDNDMCAYINNNNCEDLMTEENELTNELTLYPNPTVNEINIVCNKMPKSIKVVDLTGSIVKIFDSKSTSINVSELSKGTYFIVISTENHVYNKIFIKK